jgi:hypothetical protein
MLDGPCQAETFVDETVISLVTGSLLWNRTSATAVARPSKVAQPPQGPQPWKKSRKRSFYSQVYIGKSSVGRIRLVGVGLQGVGFDPDQGLARSRILPTLGKRTSNVR